MPKKRRKSIIIDSNTYDYLKKLKWERQKEIKADQYSFNQFIDYLCNLYENILNEINPGPTIQQIQELG